MTLEVLLIKARRGPCFTEEDIEDIKHFDFMFQVESARFKRNRKALDDFGVLHYQPRKNVTILPARLII